MSGRKAKIDIKGCVACGCCAKICPVTAIEIYKGRYAEIDGSSCVGCGKCALECPAGVIDIIYGGIKI